VSVLAQLLLFLAIIVLGIVIALLASLAIAYVRDLRGLPPNTFDARGLSDKHPNVSLWLRRSHLASVKAFLPTIGNRTDGRTVKMTISREQLLLSALVAGAILAHAYITQPSRYQFLSSYDPYRVVIRGDTRTGKLVKCELANRPDGSKFYNCRE
jgi:hypothetical protein